MEKQKGNEKERISMELMAKPVNIAFKVAPQKTESFLNQKADPKQVELMQRRAQIVKDKLNKK